MRRAPRRPLVALVALVLVPPAAVAALPAGTSSRFEPRVIGGAPAPAHAYPYAARIVVDGLGSCSGTLLASRFVLTAGHCATEITSGAAITDPARFHVRIGNGRSASDPAGYLPVDQVLRHPAFDPDRLLNDVALLRLATAAGAPTVDLLPPAKAGRLLAAGASATIAGWGVITQNPTEILAPTLYAGRIRLMSDAACVKEWHADANLPTMFCAGPVGSRTAETCSGDSGGPLLVVDPADHRTYQAGSTSFGAEDCAASSSVFARLAAPSIRSFLVTAAGLGPATIGPATVAAAGERTATVRATIRPSGADVWVSAEYGAHFERSTRPVRVSGATARAVAIPIAGLTPGRSRTARVVAWSSYGVRHSAPVRVATTDTTAPAAKPLVAKGKRGQRIRLRFRPVENSLQVAAFGEVLSGSRRIARAGSVRRFRNISAGQTYFFSFRVPTGARPTSWCVRVYDRAGHRSERRCASIRLTVRPARAPSAHPFS
jgi:secreted trypsin-like serine protease